MIKEGDKAPEFTLEASSGETVSLSDFRGKVVVLYFYPKDMTPGCTTQACDFRDVHGDFEKLGAVVLGVSRDPVKSHEKFVSKHELPFLLLSDPDARVCEAYGVFKEKNMYGRKVMGIERSTFLIDPEGTVAKVWRKVKVKGHVQEVLEEVRKLSE
ncbi:thioredoxin-dependent thiol peroxidase [Staphylospora marina]|uniref:thioredoxin-dependent thiol peroxidase n=1 Tax=Staphylospora marina TaxID=2490858 RepID=UPI000F5BECDF|nr:thioredoxin-dependent thiol peroxidase [Staphylospora marina]